MAKKMLTPKPQMSHPDISHANDTDPTHALDKTLVMRAWCFMQALNGVAPQIGRKATTGSRR